MDVVDFSVYWDSTMVGDLEGDALVVRLHHLQLCIMTAWENFELWEQYSRNYDVLCVEQWDQVIHEIYIFFHDLFHWHVEVFLHKFLESTWFCFLPLHFYFSSNLTFSINRSWPSRRRKLPWKPSKTPCQPAWWQATPPQSTSSLNPRGARWNWSEIARGTPWNRQRGRGSRWRSILRRYRWRWGKSSGGVWWGVGRRVWGGGVGGGGENGSPSPQSLKSKSLPL